MMMIDGRRSNLFIYLCKRTSCQFGQFKKKGGKKKKRGNVEFTHGREKV